MLLYIIATKNSSYYCAVIYSCLQICHCTHLTDFVVRLIESAAPIINIGDVIEDTEQILSNINGNPYQHFKGGVTWWRNLQGTLQFRHL